MSGIARGSPDDQEINVEDCDELRHWSSTLNARPEQLIEAVAKVGKAALRVRLFLEAESSRKRSQASSM
jgi:hypothetical protein